MISVSSAVQSAKEFASRMFPAADDFRLEEVELAGEENWNVVLSFPSGEPRTFANMVSGDRLYKRILVDAQNGAPLALKVFKPE